MSDFVLRPIMDADLVDICALHNRAELHDGVGRAMQLDELREELDPDHVPLATDSRVAIVGDTIVGYAYVMFLPSEEGQQRAYVFGRVDPASRGRGVGRALLAWGRDRARERLQEVDNGLPMYVRVDTYDTITDALRLQTRLGFAPVRYFEELLRPLDDLPALRDPDGIEIVEWPVGEGVQRDEEIRVVKNTAFADHWGSTPTPPARWQQMVHGVGGRPDLSHIAVVAGTGEIVGACFNERYESDDELLGRRDGWIASLSTLPAWRGRGVASALVIQSLHTFAAAGFTHASITVDGDSPTGAARLYRSLGFEPKMRSITSQIEVESTA
jgi:ribosomal protein S18 acetylase RimI-like enzyme